MFWFDCNSVFCCLLAFPSIVFSFFGYRFLFDDDFTLHSSFYFELHLVFIHLFELFYCDKKKAVLSLIPRLYWVVKQKVNSKICIQYIHIFRHLRLVLFSKLLDLTILLCCLPPCVIYSYSCAVWLGVLNIIHLLLI